MQYKYNNFYELIQKNAANYKNAPAYFVDNKKITWKEFKEKVDAFATSLSQLGVKKEDKIPILIRNSLEFVIAIHAIQKLSAIAVPINTFLKEDEIVYILNDIEASLLIASTKFENNIKNIFQKTKVKKIIFEGLEKSQQQKISFKELLNNTPQEIKELPKIDDLAFIIYTSGTTGHPKGAMLSYKNIFANIIAINKIVKITKKDRFIAYLPMFHSFTMTVNLLLPLYNASAVVIIKSIMPFSNVIKQTLLKRVTIFTGVPDVYSALSKAKIPFYFHWFNKIRFFISGAAPLPAEVLNNFQKKFKKAKLLEGYGLSECSPVVSVNRPNLQKINSVGPALEGVEIKIVNDNLEEVPPQEAGEILVRGDNVMQGYYKKEEATKKALINGWFLTGDIGKLDEDGYLYILDRKKDLIINKGVNIYPREIEEVCMKFKGIKNCAVIGIKDNNLDEIPVAFIETEEEIDITNLKKFLKSHLANYKVPKHIYIVEELPKNATGKILKRKLKEELDKYI